MSSNGVHYFLDVLFAKHWEGEFSWAHSLPRPGDFSKLLYACLSYKERDEGAELVAARQLYFIIDGTSLPQLHFIHGMAGGWCHSWNGKTFVLSQNAGELGKNWVSIPSR